MDFSWTDEQIAIRRKAAEFAEKELWPGFEQRDEDRRFDRAIWQKVASYGLLEMGVPREYGGQGRPLEELVLALEGIGYGCPDIGLLLAVGAHLWGVTDPIVSFGSESQKRRYLPGLSDGRWVGAHNVTEWDAGSDVNALATTAAESADGWVINGTKSYITNGPVADVHVVYCRLNDPERKRLICLLVPPGTPGIRTRSLSTIGTRTAALGEVVFEGCRVGRDAVLGKPGGAVLLFQAAIEKERALVFAPVIGAMQRQLDLASDYAKRRKAFGHAIGAFQAVSHRISDMAIRLEIARLLIYRMAWLKARNARAAMEASVAKIYVSEAFVQSSIDLIRTFGGGGYLKERGVEHFLRDAIGGVLFSGTNDVQRSIIARQLGLG
jgi:alkylation response protein AidB-like acyl-CoA dehydrogenase